MSDKPIGIFDSGIGGLTVVKEVLEILPNESIIYLGDTARVPYGTRDNNTITGFSLELAEFLLKQDIKALVVACNTISAVSLSEVKKISGEIPVIDVISPTVLFAIKQSQGNDIGVIGTRATTNSRAFQTQILRHNSHLNVVSLACPLFVPIVEKGLALHKSTEEIAKDYLEIFNNSNIGTLILGCTHYPILLNAIRKSLRRKIKIIDSAYPTALELKNVLEKENLLRVSKSKPVLKFFVTGPSEKADKTADIFFDKKFPARFEKINL